MDDAAAKEALAKQRFLVITMTRLGGAVMVVIALMQINGVMDWMPEMLSYLLLAFGIVEFFYLPIILARRWSTAPEDSPKP